MHIPCGHLFAYVVIQITSSAPCIALHFVLTSAIQVESSCIQLYTLCSHQSNTETSKNYSDVIQSISKSLGFPHAPLFFIIVHCITLKTIYPPSDLYIFINISVIQFNALFNSLHHTYPSYFY